MKLAKIKRKEQKKDMLIPLNMKNLVGCYDCHFDSFNLILFDKRTKIVRLFLTDDDFDSDWEKFKDFKSRVTWINKYTDCKCHTLKLYVDD
jgi:hypothetical protein